MRIERIYLNLTGDKFSPKALLNQIKHLSDGKISYLHEPTDKRDSDNIEFGFGCLSLKNPKGVCVENEIEQYESWFVEFLEVNQELIKLTGVDEIELFIELFYNKQCNFEIFSRENLSRLAKFNVAIPVSVYGLSDQSLKELLADNGFSAEHIEALNIEDN